MNGPLWRRNRPIIDYLQGVVDFLGLLLRIIIYAFILAVTSRLVWFILTKIF